MKASFGVQKQVISIVQFLSFFAVCSEDSEAKGSIFEMWMWYYEKMMKCSLNYVSALYQLKAFLFFCYVVL